MKKIKKNPEFSSVWCYKSHFRFNFEYLVLKKLFLRKWPFAKFEKLSRIIFFRVLCRKGTQDPGIIATPLTGVITNPCCSFRSSPYLRNFIAGLDRFWNVFQFGHNGVYGFLDAASDVGAVGALDDALHPLGHDCTRQHSRTRRAVPCFVVRIARNILDKLNLCWRQYKI